jgi:hypothetical protein
MNTDSRIAFPPRPPRPETKEPQTWTWTTPSPAAGDECPHGLADRAWCVFCSPAARRPEARNGRR